MLKNIRKSAEVIKLMKDGWHLEERTNFNNTRILAYWLGKRGEKSELIVSKKLRNEMIVEKLIDRNNEPI